MYDNEGSSVPNAGLHHCRALQSTPRGYRIQWGLGANKTCPVDDTPYPPPVATAVCQGAQQSEAAMLQAMPQSWAVWYSGLAPAQRADVLAELAAQPVPLP